MGKDVLVEILGKKIFGMAEMRNNQAEIMDLVSNRNEPILLRDNKRNACSRSALLLSPDMCDVVLATYSFEIIVEKKCENYHLNIAEVAAKSKGSTLKEAGELLLNDVLDKSRAYFAEMDLHSRLLETKSRFPWFLKILQCKSREEVCCVIGLDELLNMK